MKKKRISKAAKRRLFILIPVTVTVVAYFLISISYYAIKIYNLKKEQKTLQTELNSLKDEEETLKTDIEKLQNPDYLARDARENDHDSKEGELVIQRTETEEETETEEKKANTNHVIMAVCILILVLVAFYILKKKPKKR